MALAFPVIAVGLGALILAYLLTVATLAIVDALARETPVIGGYIGRVAGRVADATTGKFNAYARTFEAPVIRWLDGLQTSARGVAEAGALFAVAVVDRLDHLTHVTVHEIVKAFVNPVRDLAQDAQATATAAVGSIGAIYDEPLADFKGIEHGVDVKLDHLRDLVKNVDLPALGADLGEVIGQVERDAVGRVGDLRDQVIPELNRTVERLDGLPLGYLLDAAAAGTALGVLVDVLARESGLDRADCRRKVKDVCGADPAGWARLLESVVPLLALPALPLLVEAGQAMVGQLLPVVQGYVDRGGDGG